MICVELTLIMFAASAAVCPRPIHSLTCGEYHMVTSAKHPAIHIRELNGQRREVRQTTELSLAA
jgi:hypothetical protein